MAAIDRLVNPRADKARELAEYELLRARLIAKTRRS